MDIDPTHASRVRAFEAAIKNLEHKELLALLTVIEIRLGTPSEQPDDLAQACAIAHQLNNLLTAEQLLRSLSLHLRPGTPPGL